MENSTCGSGSHTAATTSAIGLKHRMTPMLFAYGKLLLLWFGISLGFLSAAHSVKRVQSLSFPSSASVVLLHFGHRLPVSLCWQLPHYSSALLNKAELRSASAAEPACHILLWRLSISGPSLFTPLLRARSMLHAQLTQRRSCAKVHPHGLSHATPLTISFP